MVIEFLWVGYFAAILDKLFYPFILYFAAYFYYVTYLTKETNNEFGYTFCLEMICLVISGKLFVHFLILELVQMARSKWSYFTDFWNMTDLASLCLNAAYVYLEIKNTRSENTVNLIGSISLALMWVKMFYFMRIFKSYAAFIRMV